MEQREFGSLSCLVREGPRGAPLFVALHGRGASADDLAPLGPEVAPDCHHVFPDAPRMWPPTGRPVGRAWYDKGPDQASEVAESRELLLGCVRAAKEAFGALTVILMGFSQGALMTLDAGLRPPVPAQLLVALSGYLFEDVGDKNSPPTMIVHGTRDDVVSIEMGRAARDRLGARGVPVTYHEFPIGHTISPEVVAVVRNFIANALPVPRA